MRGDRAHRIIPRRYSIFANDSKMMKRDPMALTVGVACGSVLREMMK